MHKSGRRAFLKSGVLTAASLGALGNPVGDGFAAGPAGLDALRSAASAPPFKLGLVTYNLAKDWDVGTLIKNCEETGFEGVELRTTHKHGVEISLGKAQRAEVRRRFADSRIRRDAALVRTGPGRRVHGGKGEAQRLPARSCGG